jgi:hypothetical protein
MPHRLFGYCSVQKSAVIARRGISIRHPTEAPAYANHPLMRLAQLARARIFRALESGCQAEPDE